jgi:hypothetical protein
MIPMTSYHVQPANEFQNEVREIFRDTFFVGRPLRVDVDNFAMYVQMSLDWYLTQSPTTSAVCIDSSTHSVVGYVLVCVSPYEYEKWIRKSARKLLRSNFCKFFTLRLSSDGRSFYSRRFLDAIVVSRRRRQLNIAGIPHVHMNVLPRVRSGVVALEFLTFADQVCRDAGFCEWIGEINTLRGRRTKALERFIGEVIDVTPNRTASFFLGQPVDRLTIRRSVIDGIVSDKSDVLQIHQ